MSNERLTKLIPVKTAVGLWGKTSIIVDVGKIWKIFDKIAKGTALSPDDIAELFDFFLSIGIVVNRSIYPDKAVIYNPKTGTMTNDHQIDELMLAIECVFKFYTSDPQIRVIDYFPTEPSDESMKRRFYAHVRTKLRNCWIDVLRKMKNDSLDRILEKLNESFSDGEDGLKRKHEVAQEAGLMISAKPVGDVSEKSDELVIYTEIDFETEEIYKLFNQKYREIKDGLKSEIYALENKGKPGEKYSGLIG